MKKYYLLLLAFFSIVAACYCQPKETDRKFNFDFELVEKGLPVGWTTYTDNERYVASIDSLNSKSGKYSATIEATAGSGGFKCWALVIPANIIGQTITLSGYLKTENVTDGYAGLWMRVDPGIAFDNMQNRGVTGTSGWTKYEITLALNGSVTKQIVVGGILSGKGKLWLDDLSVTIDGEDIRTLKLLQEVTDSEFDNGSPISSITLDKQRIKTLKDVGLIWGFLKYYHPGVSSSKFSWDYEVFRILPKLLDEEVVAKRDAILVKWIEGLGELEEGEVQSPQAEVKQESDLGWITSSGFSSDLSALLLKVKNAKRPATNRYVKLNSGVGNPAFTNENPYASMKYPDVGFRLLSLYRYWNMIQYYFPCKYLIEEDWKAVLEEFIPKYVQASSETDYLLTVLELIARINDTHANIYSPHQAMQAHLGVNYAVPLLTFVDGKAIVTSFHDVALGEESGLKVGDVITRVNGKKVEEMVTERLTVTPASNYPTQLRNIAPNLLRTNDSLLVVDFVRDNQANEATLKAYSTKRIRLYGGYQRPDTCFKMLSPDIAYLYLGKIKNAYLPELWEKIQSTSGLVIDLRCYPSEFVVFKLGQYLMPEATEFVRFTHVSFVNPGQFIFTPPLKVGNSDSSYYKGKVVILINETTQSQAEFTTMAFRVAPRATVVGSTTAGADGDVSFISLPGGINTAISGIGIYYPDGRETQRVGIIPDVEVTPTIEGIRSGRDELLEKAVSILLE